MKSVLIYKPTDREIDLAGQLDAATFTWLESLQGSSPRRDPTLQCGACHGGLYLRHNRRNRDQMHGVHYTASNCRDLVINRAVMSDEHKRQCEYHALAGQAAGLSADLEVSTTGNTRVDVVVERVGFEIQRSGLKVKSAVDRNARSVAAGLDVVGWFTDRPTLPPWYGKVPSYTTRARSWQKLPDLGTVIAIGPQVVEAVRCTYEAFGKCPRGARRPCGQFHEKFGPWPMLVDDVVTRLVAGEMVAPKMGEHIRLVSPASVRLYEELNGQTAAYTGYADSPPVHREQQPYDGRIECTRPIEAMNAAAHAERERRETARIRRLEPCEACGELIDRMSIDGRIHVATCRSELLGRWRQLPTSIIPPPPHGPIRRGACQVPACEEPAHLYPAGFLCDKHKPRLAKGA